MAQQRAIEFDVLKGIAILLVVIGHVYRTSLQGAYSALEDIIYTVHMPLFVLVSGYFTQRPPTWTRYGVYSYWKGKVLRLLLPLLFIAELHSIIISGEVGLPLQSMVGAYWFTYALFLRGVLLCPRSSTPTSFFRPEEGADSELVYQALCGRPISFSRHR